MKDLEKINKILDESEKAQEGATPGPWVHRDHGQDWDDKENKGYASRYCFFSINETDPRVVYWGADYPNRHILNYPHFDNVTFITRSQPHWSRETKALRRAVGFISFQIRTIKLAGGPREDTILKGPQQALQDILKILEGE